MQVSEMVENVANSNLVTTTTEYRRRGLQIKIAIITSLEK